MCEGSAAESVERPKQKIVTDIEQGITREAIKLHISSPLDANRVADVVALQQQVVIECRQEPREETLASVLAINQDFPIGVDDRRGCPLDYRLEPGERLGCERGTCIENDEVSPSHSDSQIRTTRRRTKPEKPRPARGFAPARTQASSQQRLAHWHQPRPTEKSQPHCLPGVLEGRTGARSARRCRTSTPRIGCA